MGTMLRSESMTLCHLFLPTEAAYSVVSELGEVGVVQFRDLNQNVKRLDRSFAREVARCFEMERQLRYISGEVKASKIKIFTSPENAKARLTPNEITALEMNIQQAEIEIKRLTQNSKQLKDYSVQLTEFKHVLLKSEEFLKNRDDIFQFDSTYRTYLDFRGAHGTDQLNIITGVVEKKRAPIFERALWRVSLGNAYYRQEDIDEPIVDHLTGQKQQKVVFLICCHGDKVFFNALKLCEGFRASMYTCPSSSEERKKLIENMNKRLHDLVLVGDQTDAYRFKFLFSVANQLQYWTLMVRKIKAIYHSLNFMNMDVTGKCLIGECWVAVSDVPIVKKALADGATTSLSVAPFLYVLRSEEEPPTYIKTNKYTSGFQNIINIYGMPTYREVNPALFSIITFPFLFAVMFGDVGHACIMICFALYLKCIEKKVERNQIRGEIFSIFFGGRYMILLMGLFSLYTGLIYNDMFSRGLNIFGSSWKIHYNKSTVLSNPDLELDPGKLYYGTPYPMGVDPVWLNAENSIIFLNSYKMKMSIIIGVLHMILGLCITIINYSHFKEQENIWLEFCPRLLLLCCLFLWLVIMIFIKWVRFSADNTDIVYGTACAPSILINFIDMMLQKHSNPSYPGCNVYLFEGEEYVNTSLLIIFLTTLPVMLFGKPLYIICKRRKARNDKKKADEFEHQVRKSVKFNDETSDEEQSNNNISSKPPKKPKVKKKNKNNDNEQEPSNNTKVKRGIMKEDHNSQSTSRNTEAAVEIDPELLQQEEYQRQYSNESNAYRAHSEAAIQEPIGEILVMSVIETIEYALGTVSHTASYLRLWALSLAHKELSEVLWQRLLVSIGYRSGYVGAIMLFLVFYLWMFFTVTVLIVMEGLSAFLHTLRLHWVEFMSKFYGGSGYAFEPFYFKTILRQEEDADRSRNELVR